MSCGHSLPGLPCPCDAPPLVTAPVNLAGLGFLPQLAAAVQVAASAVAVGKEVGIGKKKKKPAPVYVPPPSILDAFGPQNRTLVMAGLGGLGLAVILKLAKR